MVRLFGIPEAEAVGRVNRRWGRHDVIALRDEIKRESPEYWANDIYYGHDSFWWKSTQGIQPIPYP